MNIGEKIIKRLTDLADKLKKGKPVEVVEVRVVEGPNGTHHVRTKRTLNRGDSDGQRKS